MRKGQRPARHVRHLRTNHGVVPRLINPEIPKFTLRPTPPPLKKSFSESVDVQWDLGVVREFFANLENTVGSASWEWNREPELPVIVINVRGDGSTWWAAQVGMGVGYHPTTELFRSDIYAKNVHDFDRLLLKHLEKVRAMVKTGGVDLEAVLSWSFNPGKLTGWREFANFQKDARKRYRDFGGKVLKQLVDVSVNACSKDNQRSFGGLPAQEVSCDFDEDITWDLPLEVRLDIGKYRRMYPLLPRKPVILPHRHIPRQMPIPESLKTNFFVKPPIERLPKSEGSLLRPRGEELEKKKRVAGHLEGQNA